MEIKYGGKLEIGDFIAVANNNYIEFGWYCGTGKRTIQFIYYRSPGSAFEEFEKWKSGQKASGWYERHFPQNGFTIKCFGKSYVYGANITTTRVMKLENPELVFTNPEDLEIYQKSKKALTYIKFPVK